MQVTPATPSELTKPAQASAWSRSKRCGENFCDRPGCYDSVRCSCRARARYCTNECGQAMRRVHDRERKWLRRNTYAGRFKRQLEYQRARGNYAGSPLSLAES
jgi:SET domain-containing protein